MPALDNSFLTASTILKLETTFLTSMSHWLPSPSTYTYTYTHQLLEENGEGQGEKGNIFGSEKGRDSKRQRERQMRLHVPWGCALVPALSHTTSVCQHFDQAGTQLTSWEHWWNGCTIAFIHLRGMTQREQIVRFSGSFLVFYFSLCVCTFLGKGCCACSENPNVFHLL